MTNEVGVREFRQNLATWLERARNGDVVTITRVNRPTWYLVRRPPDDAAAEGYVKEAKA